MTYEYRNGWIASVFQWVGRESTNPCYIQPFSLTNVPAGIDGVEFS